MSHWWVADGFVALIHCGDSFLRVGLGGPCQLIRWAAASSREKTSLDTPLLKLTRDGQAKGEPMTSTSEANWYQDPSDPSLLRYWDGLQWTDQTAPSNLSDASQPYSALLPPPMSAPEAGAQHQTDNPTITPPVPPSRAKTGLFGSKKALEVELNELRQLIDGFGYAEQRSLKEQIQELKSQRDAAAQQVANLRTEIEDLSEQVVKTREEVILQEVGLYDYHHQLENSMEYKDQIAALRSNIRNMAKKDGGAVQGSTEWTVSGSASKGRKMVSEFSRLLLRAYNGEADVLVNKMRPYKLEAAIDQLNKARATISKLGSTMGIQISDSYHGLRIAELSLTSDFLAKKEEEKELEREEKARLREEARAHREFEAEKARLLKEQAHYAAALERLRQTGNPSEIAAAEEKLGEIAEAIRGVEERDANIRAGYVYVISNIGAFGPGVVKIGMTRRLEPMDRVRELGDASVPFRYDVHALIFSEDAVSLEGRLHQSLAEKRLNLVNMRREFFHATPSEVRALLSASDGSVLEFVEEPEAEEWHQSENARAKVAPSPSHVEVERHYGDSGEVLS